MVDKIKFITVLFFRVGVVLVGMTALGGLSYVLGTGLKVLTGGCP